MTGRTLLRAVAAAAVSVAALTFAACGSPAAAPASPTPIGGNVIAPVTMSAGSLQGATVDLVVGQVLNISTGDLAADSYTAAVADTAVASFTPGGEKSGAVFNPGITAVAPGTTAVRMTNSQGGIQPLDFTVVVAERK
ncbi:pilus assembly protein N-terminal domain-containing protein [Microbacterium flavum]|uniref:Lipoprotein n=1 Tax=Microbacterium flavum TaxID=415216 RepID=A0ABS5XSE9_9MICO|nr:pilus assembly protein N-terminal domain-containing protein [Microbacterium flavum]MBT8797445.1 hypothetical protein [Microbacterium flavum]